MVRVARSRNGVPIRLTDERWAHTVEEHCELAGLSEDILDAIEQAERVLEGHASELLAVRSAGNDKVLVVVYREVTGWDGFVITAFLTTRLTNLQRRKRLWPA
jgi:hypothetical protein